MPDAFLKLENLLFSYDVDSQDTLIEVPHISFDQGQIHGLTGESGSGKTTLLKLIYGLLVPITGKVSFQGKQLMDPQEMLIRGYKQMALVQQDFELRPRYSVRQNVEESLRRYDQETKRNKTDELLELAGLQSFSKRRAMDLSGGQKQRLAIIRAIATKPEILLLDEPFSQMDLSNKKRLKQLISDLNKTHGTTIILTTHEVPEIISMADVISVIRNGKILSIDSPSNHYFNPQNEYIAKLFGEYNLVEPYNAHNYSLPSDDSKLFVRPNQIRLSDDGPFGASIVKKKFLGAYWRLEIKDLFEKKWVVYSFQDIQKEKTRFSIDY